MSVEKSAPIRVGSLDSLRGIAILLVLAVHTLPRYDAPTGFKNAGAIIGNLGVQLFFIVSAYTMCMMWHGREAEHHRVEKFYLRRFCRIAVPYWSAIILYQFVGNFHAGGFDFWQIFTNASFLHEFFPAYINSGVPGGWSIADEMNFYFIFPLIVRSTQVQLNIIAIAWFLLIGLGLETCLERRDVDGWFTYYSLCTQLPVFLIGMASYELGRAKTFTSSNLLTTLSLGVFWIAVAFVAKHYGLEGRPFFWLEIMIIAVLVWLAVHFGISLRILSFVGRRSYSMYLLHFCAILALSKFLPIHTPWIAGFAAVLLLTVIMASAGQKTVEAWGQMLGKWLIARLPAEVEPATPLGGQVHRMK